MHSLRVTLLLTLLFHTIFHIFLLSECFINANVYGVKLPSRLRLNFSHLNKRKVRHGFKDGTNCMCDCGSATETTLHFLLQCQQYQRITELLNSIYNLDSKIRNLPYIVLKKKKQRNKLTIKFLKLSKRFDRSLRLPVFPLPP